MTAATIPPRSIRTRRIRFTEYDAMSRHFAGGDPVMSHVMAVLSSVFPEGEDFFVQSVRHYRDQITDPELRQQVAGFIGQEAIHGREHRAFNRRLAARGYPVVIAADRLVAAGRAVYSRVGIKSHQLAVTAALEHYTATLAELLLGDEEARALLTDDEVRSLWLWHALEEAEHKSVAFDVYQSVSGSHAVRSVVMHLATVGFLVGVGFGTSVSMALDPGVWRHPVRTARSVRRFARSPFLAKDTRRRIADYHRRDFHPDDNDTTAILLEWRERLFGDAGTLTGRVKASAA
jgi:predicted metal-dependent hydrolase